jgi:hypothetical protein
VCPFHKTGIFGIILFFFLLFHQVTLAGSNEFFQFLKSKKQLDLHSKYNYIFHTKMLNMDITIYNQITFYMFAVSCLYTFSFLPYGRFYNSLGGNLGMLFAYTYVFLYLSFYNVKNFF